MITGNKFEAFATVFPDEWNSEEDLDTYVRSGMSAELSESLANHIPVRVEKSQEVTMKGAAPEVHKMTLYVFSEQEMEEHDAYIQRVALYSVAADRCLNALKEQPCH